MGGKQSSRESIQLTSRHVNVPPREYGMLQQEEREKMRWLGRVGLVQG